jgi:hypothetical protein
VVVPTSASPSKVPPVRDHAIELQKRILAWANTKIDERGRIQEKYANTPEGFFQPVNSFDQDTVAKFRHELSEDIRKTIDQLQTCGANTKELEDKLREIKTSIDLLWIASKFRDAAYDFPDTHPNCAGFVRSRDKDTGIYTIVFGQASVGHDKDGLKRPFSPYGFAGLAPFTTYIKNNKFYVDTRVYEWRDPHIGLPGPLLYSVIGNSVTYPPGWDRNYSDGAIEIVDSKHVPMFQMVFENERRINISGVFPSGQGKFIIMAPTGGGEFTASPEHPLNVPLKTIFKYPSYKYLGKYAD